MADLAGDDNAEESVPILSEQDQIDDCIRQYQMYQRSNRQPKLESFLGGLDSVELTAEGHTRLIEELLKVDRDFADRGLCPYREQQDYLLALPGHAEVVRSFFASLTSWRLKPSQADTDKATERPWPAEARRNWEVGQWVNRYQLQGRLGRGGYGEVWMARTEAGETVAIKAMAITTPRGKPKSDAELDDSARQLYDEIGKLKHLSHLELRIPKYLDAGNLHGRAYLVMTHLRGNNLERRRHEGEWHWERCVRVILSLAEVLKQLHQHGCYHGDLKLQNVVLDERDEAWLVDLGSTQTYEEMIVQPSGRQKPRTEAYVAPEQELGNSWQMTAQTEMYQLGVMLYLLLTGRPPKPSDPTARDRLRRGQRTVQPPGELHSGLPRSVEDLTMELLQADVKARPRNANEVICRLRAALPEEESPLPVQPVPLIHQLPPPSRRYGGLFSLVALTALGGLVVLPLLRIFDPTPPAPVRELPLEQQTVLAPIPRSLASDVTPPIPRELGVEHGNRGPAIRRIWEVAKHPGWLEIQCVMQVFGEWNDIGLSHTFDDRRKFMLVRITNRGESAELHYGLCEFEDRFSKWPDPTREFTVDGGLQEVRENGGYLDLGPLPQPATEFEITLRLHDNQLKSITVNGRPHQIDFENVSTPAFRGEIGLMINGLDPLEPHQERARVIISQPEWKIPG